jgi:hypothetical protein
MTRRRTKEDQMLAALGLGIVGTIIIVALLIAVAVWLINRA